MTGIMEALQNTGKAYDGEKANPTKYIKWYFGSLTWFENESDAYIGGATHGAIVKECYLPYIKEV